MHLTIRHVSGGLLAQPPCDSPVSFTIEELPDSIRDRAVSFLSKDMVAGYASRAANHSYVDQQELEIAFRDDDRVETFLIYESACAPDVLELVDELLEYCRTKT